MGFHLVDLLVCALPLFITAEALDPLHHHPAVPGAVKYRNVACLRHMIPETPHIMVLLLNVIGRSGGTHLITPRVQMTGQTFDCAAFSSCIPALEAQHHRDSPAVDLTVQHFQLFLKVVYLLLVFFTGQVLRQIHTGKNAVLIPAVGFPCRRLLCSLCTGRSLRCDPGGLLCQRRLQGLCHGLQYLHGGVILVRRLNDIPGCILCISLFQHFLVEQQITVVLLISLPVVLRHSPGGLFFFRQLFKALFLLCFGDVEEQFDDHRPIVRKLLLKGTDILEYLRDFPLFYQTVKPVRQHLPVPAPVKYGNPALFGSQRPESPQKWTHGLFLCLPVAGIYVKPARVQCLDQPVDLCSFSGSPHSLKENDHRYPGFFESPLKLPQLCSVLLLCLPVNFLFHGP